MIVRLWLQVKSFGVGRTVKLPGASKSQPNTYPFGKPYAEIHADLLGKDEELYTRNGLLAMVKRNMGVKAAPEKWQENTTCVGQLCCNNFKHALEMTCALEGSSLRCMPQHRMQEPSWRICWGARSSKPW